MTRKGPALLRWLALVLVATLAATLVGVFAVGVVAVHGHSMEPTLHDGERALVLRGGAWLHRFGVGAFHPGDIVFFPDPEAPRRGVLGLLDRHLLIKRIVAGPGDSVGLEDGRLVVDGRPRAETYLGDAFRGLATLPPARVPQGRVYVMGDNRHPFASLDSRSFGPIAASSIEGRAVLVVWPLLRRTATGWHWNVRWLAPPPAGPAPEPSARPPRAPGSSPTGPPPASAPRSGSV